MLPLLPMTAPSAACTARTEQRWSAVLARDAAMDGRFVYAVRSTGVYCRPSCASRRPRRENVCYFDDVASAAAAGFRACKRCTPDAPAAVVRHAAAIERACRRIDSAEEPPALAELAREAGLSPHHFHRQFKAATGLTPRAYAAAARARRLRERLPASASVTAAYYEAGFGSSGRFYEAADALLGMTPGAYRRGGAQEQIRFAVGQCSLGAILVAATPRGICAILLGDEPEPLVNDLQRRFAQAQLCGGDAQFEQWVAQVVGFVEAPRLGLALPLDIRGTAFQQRVWQALRTIPCGSTLSYAEVAARLGLPKASRAVAGACAANALAVAIPCHRVVRRSGELSGYRWGVERKRVLLSRERERA